MIKINVIGSHDLAKINEKSWTNTSFNVDRNQVKSNGVEYTKYVRNFVPYEG